MVEEHDTELKEERFQFITAHLIIRYVPQPTV